MTRTKEIYLAGGCFWGVEHFFKGVDGVLGATPGYANGNKNWEGRSPSYKEVYTDTTGFAETVKVEYKPDEVSLSFILKLYFTIIDPLSLNRQGHDEGTRYRTGVFYTDKEDVAVIESAFLDVERKLGVKPVTELEPLRAFYPAEEYHRDYLDKNPQGYCHLPLKTFRYLRLYQDIKLYLGDEPDSIARMANITALIAERMHFFWTGFYIVKADELVLGPFQGTSACFRIKKGRGVCGTAWQKEKAIVVPDVEEFPGHIACSSLSKSEVVVPVFGDGGVMAVLDIDSDQYATFDTTDATWLELIGSLANIQ